METDDWITAIAIGLLLLLSGFFSATEIAILSVSKHRLRRFLDRGLKSAQAMDALLQHPAVLFTTILVSITALNYCSETIAASWVIRRLGHDHLWVAIAGMTVLVLICAEFTPISYAAANPEKVALLSARAVRVFTWILFPIVRVVSWVSRGLAWILGARDRKLLPQVTEEELKTIVSMEAEQGVLEEEEKEMIHSIFEFGDQVVREVMVPRTDMICIEDTGTVQEAANLTLAHRFSRLPVYQGELDHMVGVVHVKDLLPYLHSHQPETPVSQAMRPPYFVPESKRVSELLREFRIHQQSLAIILDEYGGTAGLVTIEDLLEEIVGEIFDEYDVEQPLVERPDAHSLVVDGKMSMEEASKLVEQDLPTGEFDTIAGLLYSQLGRVPERGDRVSLDGLIFVAEQVEGHRIVKVRIIKSLAGKAESGPEGKGGEG